MFSKAVWYLNKHTYHICITQHGYNQVLCLSLFIFQFCVYTHVCVCVCLWKPEDNLSDSSEASTLVFIFGF